MTDSNLSPEDRLIANLQEAAREAIEAYEKRFSTGYDDPRHGLHGPIDNQMIALRKAFAELTVYAINSPKRVIEPDASLRAAAQAVVDRWDTPLWKEAPATAECINALRIALALPIPDFLRNQENLKAERSAPETDTSDDRAYVLLESLVTHPWAEDCQECGIGQSQAFKDACALVDSENSKHAPETSTAKDNGCSCGDPRCEFDKRVGNPLRATETVAAPFKDCPRGHIQYSASFSECPSCKIERERPQSETGGSKP